MISLYSPDAWPPSVEGRVFRGFCSSDERDVIEISSPVARRPRDTPVDIQMEADDFFERKFGVRFRESSIFCTGDFLVAECYAGSKGDVRSLMPKDDFIFCWSPRVKDFYESLSDIGGGLGLSDFMESCDYRVCDLESAVESRCEIMLFGASFSASRLKGVV